MVKVGWFREKVVFSAIVIAIALAMVLLLLWLWRPREILAQTGDIKPPDITNIRYTMLSASSVRINWETDEKSDTMVNYGLTKEYGILRDPTSSSTLHQIVINNLLPGQQYFFRAVSIDAANNQAISADYSFTASGAKAVLPRTSETPRPPTPTPREGISEQLEVPQDILDIIDQITDPDLLRRIIEKLEEVAAHLLKPPTILGRSTVEIGTDHAILKWSTEKLSNSIVAFSAESDYDPTAENPYRYTQGNYDEETLDHRVEIIGLLPATTYHYRVMSSEKLGPPGMSTDDTFRTKAVLPEIRTVKLAKVEEHSATITWTTNIPTSALIEYTNQLSKEKKSTGNPSFLTTHSLKLENLQFKTPYVAVVQAENEIGDRIESRPLLFTTIKDEFPPVISRVTNESTLYPGEDTKVQTIVGWETDETARCQFFYHEGLVAQKPESFLEEANPVLRHVQVITTFQQSTIYKFWLECKDEAGNKQQSPGFVLFTPAKEKSILDIIIDNFSSSFGWVKNIGK